MLLRAQGEGNIIFNALGFAGFISPGAGESGLSIPLDRRHVLMIIPQRDRIVAEASGNRWRAAIQYGDLDQGNHLMLNRTLTEVAQRFIFGPTEEAIRTYLTCSDDPIPVPDPI